MRPGSVAAASEWACKRARGGRCPNSIGGGQQHDHHYDDDDDDDDGDVDDPLSSADDNHHYDNMIHCPQLIITIIIYLDHFII